MKIYAAILALMCFGVQAKPWVVCMQPGDQSVPIQGCDAQVMPTPELDASKSAAQQSALSGLVIGWIGGDPTGSQKRAQRMGEITPSIIGNAPARIAAIAQYRNIGWVYAADEYGHCATGSCLYDYTPQLIQISALSHAAGKHVLISMLPGTIDQYPDQPIAGINDVVDAIAVVVYKSIPYQGIFPGCIVSSNELINQAACSIAKLRRMGFTGYVLLIYQGFALTTESEATIYSNLLLQRELIDNAQAIGFYAEMAWGCRLSAAYVRSEPILRPLCGTSYEGMVTP